MGSTSAYQELRRQYNDLVNWNVAGIFRTTLDGRFLECNDAMAHMLGYENGAALLEQSTLDLYHAKADREQFVTRLHQEKKLTEFEIRLKHRSGREVHVLENVFLDEAGDPAPTIRGMMIDITRFRQTELEQRALMASYKNLVEHIRDGIIVVSGGEVRYANPAADTLLGTNLVGRAIRSLFRPEDHGTLERLIDDVKADRGTGPIHVRPSVRPEREIMLYAAPHMHDGTEAVQLTLQDIGEQRGKIQERIRLQMAEEVNEIMRQEIVEHRRTQEELKRSKRFARALVDSSLDMIMAADPEGIINEYNPAASLRFGYEPEEVLRTPASKLYADPEEFERVKAELDTHGIFTGEVRNIDKDGNEFISFLSASRMFDEEGRLIGAMGVSRDITHARQVQEDLRVSEERYRDLFENATDLIQSVDAEGRFEYVNSAWRKTLGYTTEELENMSIWEVVHPAHLVACQAVFSRVMRGDDPGQIRTVFRTKEGRSVTVEGTSNLRTTDGRPTATRSIFRDITGVLAARQQVQEHEAKLRALFESSEHMFWTVDPGLRLTSFNRGYGDMIERLHGARPELNKDPKVPRRKFASDAYHAFWEEKYNTVFAGRSLRFETDLTDRRGGRVSNEIFLSPVFGPDGEVTEVFGVGHEVTEQKVAEDLVREQAARLKAIFESSANMMIWTLDKEMRITSCNAYFQQSIDRIHGIRFNVGDAFTERMSTRLAPERVRDLLDKYAIALGGKPQQFEVELFDLEGKPAWVENFLNPIIVNGEVQELSCLAYGITDRKEAQREIEQSLNEKEVLLKEVHHRVKNNLQVISSIMSLQTMHVENDPRLQEVLHHSRDRIRSMAMIHESLYQNKEFSSIDLGGYIDGLARNLVMSYSLNGRVSLELDLTRVELVLDQALPCGLILNEIISNALKHGFPDGRGGIVRIGLSVDKDTVSITIGDDGVGMQDGFDEERDGSLGLELVHMLVGQLDGRIQRRSGGLRHSASATAQRGVTYLLTFERTKNSGHGADERPRSGG